MNAKFHFSIVCLSISFIYILKNPLHVVLYGGETSSHRKGKTQI